MKVLRLIITILVLTLIFALFSACTTTDTEAKERIAEQEKELGKLKAEEEPDEKEPGEEAKPPPVAKITINRDTEATVNTKFNFSGLDSSSADGSPLTYEWILWDGTRESGVFFDTVFNETGDYKIKLIVSDGEATAEDSIMISITGQPPKIVLSDKNIYCDVGDTLEISAAGTKDQEGNDAIITWLLPDGTKLEGEEIEYVVPEVGKSKIVVTAADGVNESVEEISISAKESLEQYKESCQKVSYDDLLRYPDDYFGKRIYTKAEIVQKLSEQEFHVNITEGRYGYYDDRAWLVFETVGISLIEKDIIEVWGMGLGNETYETVMGAKKTIPVILGEHVNLVKKAGDR